MISSLLPVCSKSASLPCFSTKKKASATVALTAAVVGSILISIALLHLKGVGAVATLTPGILLLGVSALSFLYLVVQSCKKDQKPTTQIKKVKKEISQKPLKEEGKPKAQQKQPSVVDSTIKTSKEKTSKKQPKKPKPLSLKVENERANKETKAGNNNLSFGLSSSDSRGERGASHPQQDKKSDLETPKQQIKSQEIKRIEESKERIIPYRLYSSVSLSAALSQYDIVESEPTPITLYGPGNTYCSLNVKQEGLRSTLQHVGNEFKSDRKNINTFNNYSHTFTPDIDGTAPPVVRKQLEEVVSHINNAINEHNKSECLKVEHIATLIVQEAVDRTSFMFKLAFRVYVSLTEDGLRAAENIGLQFKKNVQYSTPSDALSMEILPGQVVGAF